MHTSATSNTPRRQRERLAQRHPATRQRIGPVVISTVYFGGLASGQRHVMSVSLVAVAVITALSCLVAPLLPRRAQPGPGH
jgi:hypothetical protein